MSVNIPSRTVKPKAHRSTTGYSQGGQLSRAPKPPQKTGRFRAKNEFPGAK